MRKWVWSQAPEKLIFPTAVGEAAGGGHASHLLADGDSCSRGGEERALITR